VTWSQPKIRPLPVDAFQKPLSALEEKTELNSKRPIPETSGFEKENVIGVLSTGSPFGAEKRGVMLGVARQHSLVLDDQRRAPAPVMVALKDSSLVVKSLSPSVIDRRPDDIQSGVKSCKRHPGS